MFVCVRRQQLRTLAQVKEGVSEMKETTTTVRTPVHVCARYLCVRYLLLCLVLHVVCECVGPEIWLECACVEGCGSAAQTSRAFWFQGVSLKQRWRHTLRNTPRPRARGTVMACRKRRPAGPSPACCRLRVRPRPSRSTTGPALAATALMTKTKIARTCPWDFAAPL